MTRFEKDGQRGLHATDAAPRVDEIAALHRGWHRRVVGTDDVQASPRELVIEVVLIARGAQRRRTLRVRTQPLDILFGKRGAAQGSDKVGLRGARQTASSPW